MVRFFFSCWENYCSLIKTISKFVRLHIIISPNHQIFKLSLSPPKTILLKACKINYAVNYSGSYLFNGFRRAVK